MTIAKLRAKYRGLPVQLKASFWFLVCSFLQRGISVITTPIFTRILTTAEYGDFSVFNSWLGIAQAVVTLNLCFGMFNQAMVKFEDDRRTFAASMQGLALLLVTCWTIAYLLLMDQVNALLGMPTEQVLLLLVLVWTGTVFNFWSVEQRVQYRYRTLVVVTLLTSIAKPVLGIVLVLSSEDKVTARILGIAIVELAGFAWMFFYQAIRGKKLYSRRYWKYALVFCLPLLPHYLSQVALAGVDRIMIGWLENDSAAGIYSLAYSLSQIMVIVNTAICQTLDPWVYQQLRANTISKIKGVAYPALVFIAASNLIVIVFAPELIAIFAPQEYSAAVWVVPPVSISVYFMFTYNLFVTFEFYYEKTWAITFATAVGAVVNIALNFFLIPRFGFVAAGYSTLLCYVLYSIMHYSCMQWICNSQLGGIRPYSLKVLLGITTAFVAIGLSYLLTYDNAFLRYSYAVVLALVCIAKRQTIAREAKKLVGLRTGGKDHEATQPQEDKA